MTTVDLSGGDGRADLTGYLATPAGEGPWPGIVMVHEAFGIDDVMRRQADRLAAAGYRTLAPDLFAHGGPRRCLVSTLRALRAGTGRPFAEIDAARRWLLDSPDSSGRVGIVGFCMGGAFALLAATRGFDVAAPNYGLLPADVGAAMQGACPVVASYGGRDRLLPGAARALGTALTRAGIAHDVKEYPSAGHSFLNDAPVGPWWMQPIERIMGIGPEPEAAADAWTRIEAFLDRYLRQHDPLDG